MLHHINAAVIKDATFLIKSDGVVVTIMLDQRAKHQAKIWNNKYIILNINGLENDNISNLHKLTDYDMNLFQSLKLKNESLLIALKHNAQDVKITDNGRNIFIYAKYKPSWFASNVIAKIPQKPTRKPMYKSSYTKKRKISDNAKTLTSQEETIPPKTKQEVKKRKNTRAMSLFPNKPKKHKKKNDETLITEFVTPEQEAKKQAKSNAAAKPLKPKAVKAPSKSKFKKPQQDKHKQKKKKKVVIDASHGGVDIGAIGAEDGVMEKDLTLTYARNLKKTLEETGKYQVYLTRNQDATIALPERLKAIKKHKPDLVISLQAPASKNTQVQGFSVTTFAKNKFEKTKSKSQLMAEKITNNMQNSGYKTQQQNTANHPMLKSISAPALLVKLGSISNAQDEKILMDDANMLTINQNIEKAL